jgi:hypothetical protein
MRPVEHFLAQLDKFERLSLALRNSAEQENAEDRITKEFVSLTAPVIGNNTAQDLCFSCLDRLRSQRNPPYSRLGYVAAFLLKEFDATMELDSNDWEDIRDTLEDAAGEMDMDTLTTLMGELLSRGELG